MCSFVLYSLKWVIIGVETEGEVIKVFFLKNERLRVEIAEPGEAPNHRTRFDRAAYISDVLLDGEMRFTASEPRNLVHPTSGGMGFCRELRCDVSADAKVGAYYPKFGVGLIRREDEPKYSFYKEYTDVIPFDVSVEHDSTTAYFLTASMPCLGYALESRRKVTLQDTTLTVETELHNTGDKAISMEEFCHNFISIDGMAVGSDYHLEIPSAPDLGQSRLNNRRGFSGVLRGEGRGVTFCEFTAIDTDYAIDCNRLHKDIPFTWKLSHQGAKAYVLGADSFVPGKIAIWGVDHMLCPEIVHCFTLEPGERIAFSRALTFGREGQA